MSDFGNMLQYTQNDYEYENQTVTFIDNHDVTRFGYIQQNKKVYNAGLAALLTCRGIPNIYYGTEQYVKPSDSSDVSGRIFMEKTSGFDKETTEYKLIKKTSELRQYNEAIPYGKTSIMYSDDNVIVYERKFFDNIVLIAINRQPDRKYTISNVKTTLPDGIYEDYLESLLNGNKVTVNKGVIKNLRIT